MFLGFGKSIYLVKKIFEQQSILNLLILDTLETSGHLPAAELAAAMGYAKVSGAVSKAIRELIAEGKVVYSEPGRIHSKNQKICLVEDCAPK